MSPGILLIAILAILGMGAPLIRSSAPLDTLPPIAPAKNETATHYEHSALDLLEEFFNADPDQLDTTKPWSPIVALCRIERRPPRLALKIYPYLPRATVATTLTKAYLSLLAGAAS